MSVQQFETRLQQLDDAIRRQSESALVIALARDALNCFVPTLSASLLLTDPLQTKDAGPKILLSTSHSPEAAVTAAQLSAVASDPFQILTASGKLSEGNKSSGALDPKNLWVACRRPLSSTVLAIVVFEIPEEPADARLLRDAVDAISDALQSVACRTLIESLLRQQDCQRQLNPVVHELLTTTERDDVLQQFVEKASSLLSQTRVSMCSVSASGIHLVAISGTTSHDANAAAVKIIEEFVAAILSSRLQNRWLHANGSDLQHTADHKTSDELRKLSTLLNRASVAGIKAVRCETLSSIQAVDHHVLVFEHFGSTDERADDHLIHALVDSFRAVILRKGSQKSQSDQVGSRFTRRRIMIAAALLLLASLWLIPARFEVEVSGQLFPSERRRVFAPDDGMVEEVLVESDQRVSKDAPLLRLRNPERELELNRILGEIETTTSRLQAVRATRSGSTNRTTTDISELGSEEQQLEQKLKTLREEQSLLENQIASLTLKAPVEGLVYQRRLQEQLTARPVQRGQMLLEIGNDEAGWIAELSIPDDLVGYVRAASNGENHVEFVRAGDSGRSESAMLKSLSNASHVEDGQTACLAFAQVQTSASNDFRPGESVTARIDCGRRSLGFVWFRELIEFCQKKRFAWL